MENLHPGAKWVFRLRTYGIFLTLIIFFFWAFLGIREFINGLGIITGIIIGLAVYSLLAIIVGEIYAALAFKCFKYEFTQNFLKIEKGIIWRRYSNVPYERVQNVDVRRGVVARIIGFSSVDIQTAGYSGYGRYGRGFSEGYLPAVSVEEAEKIREFLMKRIGKKQGL